MSKLIATSAVNITETIRTTLAERLLRLANRTEPWFAVIAPGMLIVVILLMLSFVIINRIDNGHPMAKSVFRITIIIATTIMVTTTLLTWTLLNGEIERVNSERIAEAEVKTAIVEQVKVNPDDGTTTYILRNDTPITMSINNETLIPDNEIQSGLEIEYVKYRKFKNKEPSYAILNGQMPKDTGR